MVPMRKTRCKTCPTIPLCALILGMIGLVGCQAQPVGRVPLRWADPIMPLAAIKAEDSRTRPTPDPTPGTDLILMYLSDHRQFDEAPGVDGYVLRVIPINTKPQSQRGVVAGVTISLFEGRDPYPFLTWDIPPNQLDAYWMPGRPCDGYVFRLHWGSEPVPKGRYRLNVVWAYQDRHRPVTLCRDVYFDDQAPRAVPE